MQFDRAKRYILAKLKKELRPQFTYHCFDHTIDVCNAAKTIGTSEGISRHDMKLLLTATLFHDSGFTEGGSNDHEEKSCLIALECLPGFNYAIGDIEKINGMIMATKLPQSPHNHLEEIICDADLDYLGRDDFFAISDRLYEEFLSEGKVQNYDDWNKKQIAFFEGHKFFTNSSISMRNAIKGQNLAIIKMKV